MKNSISKSNLNSFKNTFNSNNNAKISRNALVRSDINNIAMDWDGLRSIDHTYSDVVSNEMEKVTNQKASGRCWGFAGLNLMRLSLAEKYNLKNFEFSQNYFMFCDKLEKSNYFLENILKTFDEAYDSRLMMHLLSEPVQDGGQWDMFVNLIEKYGVIPQSVMPESFQSSQSRMMNGFLTRKLREFAYVLRDKNKKGVKLTQLRKDKEEMLSTIPPRANGGNMDDPSLVEGTTVYFPVFVEGALFSIGDGHAVQGYGEVCGSAIEAPMTFTYRLRVIKDKPAIEEPQYETEDHYAVTGFGETIDIATKKAVNYMVDYLSNNYDISEEDSYMLCSLVGDLKIAEVVDVPNMLVTMHFPKSILNQL